MKKGKKILMFFILACLLLGLSGCSGGKAKRLDASVAPEDYVWPEEPEKVYTLRCAVTIAPETASGATLLAIKDELAKKSNGAINLDIFWESTLGGANELGEGLKIGSINIGLVSSAVISNYTSSIDVFSLPFIISDREQFKASVDVVQDKIYEDVYEALGEPLGIWESGFRHLCTKDKRVASLEDCKGLTIRVMDGQVYSNTFKALGCIPSNVALTELVPALQQGAIDGVEEPVALVANQQQYSFCKYLTMIGYNYTVMCPILSKQTIKDMPEEVISLVEEVFHDYRFYSTDVGAEYDEQFIQQCEDGGMEIIYLPEEEMQKFRDAVSGIWEEYADSIGQDLIDQVSNAGN